MGDMADWVISNGIESELMYGEDDPERFSEEASCKYCNKSGLAWGVTEQGRWRLFDPSGCLHTCPEYKQPKEPDDDR